jgi:hypothetical protein
MAKKKLDIGKKLFDSQEVTFASPDRHYSGDQPNPNLRSLVEDLSKPFDPSHDTYSVPAFRQAITTTRGSAIFNMHTYWSKKPHDAIRQYIRHYTNLGDLVLDPFSGSGGTALASLLEGRHAIAIDRSPAATFITLNYCASVSSAELNSAFATVIKKAGGEIEQLYSTLCDRCDGDAVVSYTVLSNTFQCLRCLKKVALYDCIEVESRTAAGKPTHVNVCPSCHQKGHNEIIRSQSEKFGFVPVMTCYSCRSGCKPVRSTRSHNDTIKKKREYFATYDLAKLKQIDSEDIPYAYPQGYSMTDFSRYQRDALFYYGVKEVADLFTKRNLRALATLKHGILQLPKRLQQPLLFCFTSILLKSSRMMGHNNDGIGRIQKGTYYLPQLLHDVNVLNFMQESVGDMASGYDSIGTISHPIISTQSSVSLAIPSSSIDYIFTDPSYADKVQYGELNFVWEAWLGLDVSWHAEEIVVNERRGISETDWADRMRLVLGECYRVLKPGRWLSLCYHDTSEGTWAVLQDLLTEAGFVSEQTSEAVYIDTHAKTTNQYFADKVTRRDLVVNFRKPKPGERDVTQVYIPENVDVPTFLELGQQVIRNYLSAHPGSTKDRVYDSLISCMVHKGQIEAHDFDSLLRTVADEVQQPVKADLFRNKDTDLFGSNVQSRWYLKETADQVDHAEQAKEDAAAARLSKFIGGVLKKQPEFEGVHYSDLFEQYLPIHDKPRRLLADWLVEYFIKTASGTWRLPDKEEAQQLAELRKAGTLRRIKRFANALIEGVPVRDKDRPGSDVDLLDWLRQCRRAGLYEQGKAIYEKGGMNSVKLTDEQQIEAEDDYRICARRGSTGETKPKRKSRKKQDDNE